MLLYKFIISNIYALLLIILLVPNAFALGILPSGLQPILIILLVPNAFALGILPSGLQSMVCESLKTTGGHLCVIHAESTLDEWFFFPPQNAHAIKLEAIPQSLANTDDFKVSPSEKWVAIISVGEGHPILDVVVLADVLENETTTALRTINPYPGSINLKRWEGDNLIIESDRDLTQQDESLTIDDVNDEVTSFILHVPSGRIKPCKK